jgi:N-acetylmuramoyl-L-alanine amidase
MNRIRVLGLAVFLATATNAAELKDIRLWAGPEQTRVVFDLSSPVQHQVQVLEHPDRIVIDINNTRKAGSLSARAGKGVVSGVRTGIQPGGTLRVVLDVSSKVVPHTFALSPNAEYGNRLVIDLDADGAPSEDQALESISGDADAMTAADGKSLPVVPEGPPAAPAKPQLQVKADPVTPADRNLKPIIVAVDAGHGGEDTGARGPSGVREKDVALSIARKLARLINKEPGMKAVLIRDGDYYIGLRERTIKARKAQADLFISVHADAFRNRDARGSSVYVLSQRGASSEHARSLAERENASDLVGGVRLTGRNDRDAFLLSVLQDTSMEASFDVASRVLGELKDVNDLHKREVQQAGFMVLKSPDIPSLLVETAFISNRKEERRLNDDDYQDTLARALLRGVKGYFSSYRPGRTLAEADPSSG